MCMCVCVCGEDTRSDQKINSSLSSMLYRNVLHKDQYLIHSIKID